MATEVIIPALGVVVEKVKILNWFKSEGDRVEKGEPLLEIESDKVVTEISTPASGILGPILYEEGAEVGVTQMVAIILAEGEDVPEQYRQKVGERIISGFPLPSQPASQIEKPSQPVKAAPAARKLAEEKGVDLSLVTPTGPHGTMMKHDVEAYLATRPSEKRPQKVSSLARKAAEDLHVPLENIQGTGAAGLIMKADVLRAADQKGFPGKEEGLFGKIIPISKMRQVIARRLTESAFTAPHIYLFTEMNMEGLLSLRESILEEFEKRFQVRLSINDCFIKAVALAIREYPLFNASLRGDEIHVHPEINVGLAVALDEGLIVPAILQADRIGLGAIAQQRADLVDRARKGKLTLQEIERGTFTVSSLANFDITFFTAILNPPQSGILSVGKVQDQLYLQEGKVRSRKVAQVGLSADHRIIDGAMAARFLETLKRMIENPIFYFLYL